MIPSVLTAHRWQITQGLVLTCRNKPAPNEDLAETGEWAGFSTISAQAAYGN